MAHVIDGIHRLTALECVLRGYQQPDTDNYAVRLPHAGTNLPITSMVPPELDLESKDFLDDMKKISSECQQSFGSLQPHSKKDFFAAKGVDLSFIRPTLLPYAQGKSDDFTPGLSMIDVLMWNEPNRIKQMLANYTLE